MPLNLNMRSVTVSNVFQIVWSFLDIRHSDCGRYRKTNCPSFEISFHMIILMDIEIGLKKPNVPFAFNKYNEINYP